MGNEEPAGLSPEEKQELLNLARGAVEHYLKTGERLPYESSNPALTQECGAFVSFHRKEQLCGCIGYITSENPLFKTVIDAAISAATADHRFPRVELEELPELEIEISVLTPPQKVKDPKEITVGRDGLIITAGHQRGLLLPQVATRYGWDRNAFLDRTCAKAGLEPGAWREGAVIERFSAQVFNESEPE